MAFSVPGYYASLHWGEVAGTDQSDPDALLLEIRPGEHDTVTTANRRQLKQYETTTSWPILLGLIGDNYAELELAIGSVDLARFISNAEGVQLDEIGELYGRPRGSMSDDEFYKLAIRADAATLFASGTPPEVIEIARIMLSDGIRYRPLYPATFAIEVADPRPGFIEVLADVLSDLPVAGVAGLLVSWDSSTTGVWSTNYGPVTGTPAIWDTNYGGGAGDAVSPWADVRPMGS